MSYTFTLNTNRAFKSVEGVISSDMNERIAQTLEADNEVSSGITHLMPDLLRKWGFTGTQLKSFRFESTQSPDSPLPVFHLGMASDLIRDFLADPEVASQISMQNGTLKDVYKKVFGEGRPTIEVEAQTLECSETTLSVLDRVLHCPQLVRNPRPMPTPEEVPTTDINKVFRYPTIRQMDIFLPSGVTISDALREYVMLPDDTYSENRVRMLDNDLEDNGTAPEGDIDLSEDRHYPLLSRNQRNQFLYHVFWRLVSGGTSLCQYEEDAIFYKLGAREVYKDIVCVGRRKAARAGGSVTCILSAIHQGRSSKEGDTIVSSFGRCHAKQQQLCLCDYQPLKT